MISNNRIEFFRNEDILEVWAEAYALDPISVKESVTFPEFLELDAVIEDVYGGEGSESYQIFQDEVKAFDE